MDVETWVDGWKPESIAFRYFNMLQMYKTKMDVSLRIIYMNFNYSHG